MPSLQSMIHFFELHSIFLHLPSQRISHEELELQVMCLHCPDRLAQFILHSLELQIIESQLSLLQLILQKPSALHVIFSHLFPLEQLCKKKTKKLLQLQLMINPKRAKVRDRIKPQAFFPPCTLCWNTGCPKNSQLCTGVVQL